jgi:hypothetical protein
MKYIIRESMVSNVFKNYMNSQYDLKYNHNTREFINVNNGEIFGYILGGGKFYHYDYSQELFLEGMFGSNMDKLLLNYLIEKFPEVDIRNIGH